MSEFEKADASADPSMDAILVINSGSSSVKYAVYSSTEPPIRLFSGAAEHLGDKQGWMHARDSDGAVMLNKGMPIADHDDALRIILDIVVRHPAGAGLVAVGHRIVHGGPSRAEPLVLSAAIEDELRELSSLAPLHQPHNLAGVAAVRRIRPNLPQIACFDTAFHGEMPRIARLTTLPRSYYDNGICRYGFHGVSYEFILCELRRQNVQVERERIIIAHLGNGSSMCAVKNGQSIETTMGFSTLSGLPMGTRCGDIDPGIILYLASKRAMTVERLHQLLYEESGMLGVSQLTYSMKELVDHLDDPAAREAIDLYCYHARQRLAGLSAVLSGLDRIVFTGGIGANAPFIRSEICSGLEYLGVDLDPARNAKGECVISKDNAGIIVQAMQTDEEIMIARHVRDTVALLNIKSKETDRGDQAS